MSGEVVVAKFDYVAQEATELSVKKNERLILLDDSRNWWKVRNEAGQGGFVPSNFVRRQKSLMDTLFKRKSSTSRKENASVRPVEIEVAQARPPLPNFSLGATPDQPHGNSQIVQTVAIVKYPYEATRNDELGLTKGEQVTVFEKSSDGWWLGELRNGSRGWFPSNYVIEQAGRNKGFYTPPDKVAAAQLNGAVAVPLVGSTNGHAPHGNGLEARAPPQPFKSMPAPPPFEPVQAPAAESVVSGADVLERVIALYNFDAQDDSELSCVKGEWLDCIDKPVDDPEWWKMRNLAGKTGLVPMNYVKVMPDAQPTKSGAQKPLLNNNRVEHFLSSESHVGESNRKSVSPKSAGGAIADLNPMIVRAKVSGTFAAFPWYFGALSRDEADMLLNEFGSNGDFLVRDSESNPGDFSISLAAASRNKHFWIRVQSGEYLIGSRRFSGVEDIIRHYKTSPIYTNDSGETLYLIRPLPS